MIPLQYWISVVILVGMLETTFTYEHYQSWNDHGTANYSMSIGMMGIFFGSLKKALSRVIVLVVAAGYGIVKSSLGDAFAVILMSGVVYTLLACMYDSWTSDYAGSIAGVNEKSALLPLSIVLAVMDTGYYLATIKAISSLLIQLEARRQLVKLRLYSRFRDVLLCSLVFSGAWAVYVAVFVNNDPAEHLWRQKWAVNALWEVSYFVILAALAFLFAPSKNSLRYATSIELSPMDRGGDAAGANEGEEEEQSALIADRSGSTPKQRKYKSSGGEVALDAEYGGALADSSDPTLQRAQV